MIKLNGINKYYNLRKQNEIHVLKDISCEFDNKGLTVIVGESGSGKSTLLNILCGLDSPTSGKIIFNETIFDKYISKKWDKIRNHKIGFIYQNFLLVAELSVRENIEVSLKMQGCINYDDTINNVVKYLNISGYIDNKVNALSGGERQRVAIARALAKNPDILIADEPTGNLDSKNTIDTMNIIRSIADEKLVILVTHEEEIAKLYADRIIRLSDGEITVDKKNEFSKIFDVRQEQSIYLKELHKQEGSIGAVNLSTYQESKSNDKQIKLKVIEKNQTLYLDIDKGKFRNAKLINQYSELKIIDDYYRPKEFETIKDVLKELDKKKNNQTFSYKDTYKYTMNKINNINYGGKMLYFSLALIGAVIAISIGLLGDIFSYDDHEFIETSRHYINISTNDLTYEELLAFNDYEFIENINIFTEQQEFLLETESFYEVRSPIIFNAHPSNSSLLTVDMLMYGELPTNDYQVVVDKFLADEILFYNRDRGMSNYEDILSSNLLIQSYGLTSDYKEDAKLEFEIVGISNDDSPTIWISDSLAFSIVMSSLVDYELFGEDLLLLTGRMPESEYELLLHENSSLIRNDNIPSSVGISSGEYLVVGTYSVTVNGVEYNTKNLMITNINIMKRAYFHKHDYDNIRTEFLVYTNNVENALLRFGEEDINAVSKYHQDSETYQDFTFNNSFGLFIFAISGLIISGISVIFVMRSSLPSRVNEVSIYRALGASKKDIIKLFTVEIIITTCLSSLIGFIGTVLFLIWTQYQISMYVEILYYNLLTILSGIILMFLINIIFGLIPISFLLRKTPADIIKSTDI